jgi:hypothetical protein
MRQFIFVLLIAALVLASSAQLRADADETPVPTTAPGTMGHRVGLLDFDSKYFRDAFPEPFRVEDTTLNNELRFDWEHDQAKGVRSDAFTAEMQKSVGIVTLEVQGQYITSSGRLDLGDGDDAGSGNGFENVQVGGRVPILQFISNSGSIDNSIGINLEGGIPTNSQVSKNASASIGIFDDLALGDHFTLQTLFSYSRLFGSLPANGRDLFDYGLAFGYAIEDEQLPIPDVERLIPIAELVGETSLTGAATGQNVLTGTAGLRIEFKPIDKLQPQFGVGYVFPIDSGGRRQIQWGLITSLTLEF